MSLSCRLDIFQSVITRSVAVIMIGPLVIVVPEVNDHMEFGGYSITITVIIEVPISIASCIHIVWTASVLQFCLLASTGYHLFRCHSPKAYLRWLSLDLTGILIGLLGCYLPGIHLGFYCLSVKIALLLKL